MSISTAFSQKSYGLKGGFNISQLAFYEEDYYDFRASGHIGMFSHMRLPGSRYTNLCVELLYSGEGVSDREYYYDDELDDYTGNIVASLALNYLQFPVYLKFPLVQDYFTWDVGAQYGLLLNAAWKEDGLRTRLNLNEFRPVFALLGGISANGEHFLLEMHYTYGLTSPMIDENRVKNLCFRLSLGYQF